MQNFQKWPVKFSQGWQIPQGEQRASERATKEAAKVARNTPKAVSILPTPLPQVVEADQAPTAGIPPVPDPLEPTILPQVVEAG